MKVIVVTSHPGDWSLDVPGVQVVDAQNYLRDPEWVQARRLAVFNLCRSYRHQGTGYYVSLLAAARGHRPFPTLSTLLDMRSRPLVRMVDDDLQQQIQRALAPLKSGTFTLSVYFGANVTARYDKLALALFQRFPAPLLRAQFVLAPDTAEAPGEWHLTSVTPIPAREIPDGHHAFAEERATAYFARPRTRGRRKTETSWDMAVLYDAEAEFKPSGPSAIKRFTKAAERQGMAVEVLSKDDINRLAEFDALFIRETTLVHHHTFRFAQRAEQLGLVVIDDPQSILRCTNKVFQAEAMRAKKVPMPATVIVGRNDLDRVEAEVGLPCVLKHPESSFSQGVVRCADAEQLEQAARTMLADTDLIVAQEFVPTEFDWRVGVLGGEALYACRYHMAAGHWQIVQRSARGKLTYGNVESLPVDEIPKVVLRAALKAAALIGDGLYGVDLKQFGERCVVMEINDNPNLDVGCEDEVLGEQLWDQLVGWFIRRLQERTRP